MALVKKIVLVSAEHHPHHVKWLRLAEEVAKESGAHFEYRPEDYLYAIEHGRTDEFGMAGLPQLFAETEEGRVHLLLWEVPLNERLEPDFEEAKRIVLRRLAEIGKP